MRIDPSCDEFRWLVARRWRPRPLGNESPRGVQVQNETRNEQYAAECTHASTLEHQRLVIVSSQHSRDDARNSLERSIDINREFGESVSLAEALHELGLLSLRTGEHEAAREALQQAERIFAQAGARLDLVQVRQDLESLDA